MEGPANLIKFRRSLFDQMHASAIPSLKKRFAFEDINVRASIYEALQNEIT